MKKLLFTVLSFTTVAAYAQSANEIIDKYINNMGGLDAFKKINTMKITGTYSTQGMDLSLTVQIINGKGVRSDVEIGGQSITNSYLNGKGWKINPAVGITERTELTEAELKESQSQSNIVGPLMDYKAKGHPVEMLGKEPIEGIDTYKIKLTNKDDGKVTTYFIMTKDYTILKSVVTRDVQGEPKDFETWYSDLKEVDGVKFFMVRESKVDGETYQTTKYEKVELNIPIDEKVFEIK